MSFPSEIGEERMLRNTCNEAKTLGKGPPLQGTGGLWKQSIGYTLHDGGPRGSRV